MMRLLFYIGICQQYIRQTREGRTRSRSGKRLSRKEGTNEIGHVKRETDIRNLAHNGIWRWGRGNKGKCPMMDLSVINLEVKSLR